MRTSTESICALQTKLNSKKTALCFSELCDGGILANVDIETVQGFGQEWAKFDHSQMDDAQFERSFNDYFRVFPWEDLASSAEGFDLGCGSGRWAKFVADRVSTLHCIDASEKALNVARRNLEGRPKCLFHRANVDEIPLTDCSMDFGYSLGVLHHVPDTLAGLQCCVRKLKPGGIFLTYLYYAFDNRSAWFRTLWKISNWGRILVSRLPFGLKYPISQLIAVLVYYPVARTALMLEKLGFRVESIPLSFYRDKSFYIMRTDSLDRFGTRLEKRFTAKQITSMMEAAGLEHIKVSPTEPFWCAVGYKRTSKV